MEHPWTKRKVIVYIFSIDVQEYLFFDSIFGSKT